MMQIVNEATERKSNFECYAVALRHEIFTKSLMMQKTFNPHIDPNYLVAVAKQETKRNMSIIIRQLTKDDEGK